MYYGLSERGGGRWEAHAVPDWDRYLEASFRFNPEEGTTVSGTRDLMEQWLSAQRDLNQWKPIADSIRWDVLRPWQATYWKSVPVGHRVHFQFEITDVHHPNRAAEWKCRRV